MKIIITEDQKKKLFIPRRLDDRVNDLKKQLINSTKKLFSKINFQKIVSHGRIDDYDDEINGEFISDSYGEVIIDNKSYFGIPFIDNVDKEIINKWEDVLATYINSILPQPTNDSIEKSRPNIVGRMFKVTITPKKIDIIFSYQIIDYIEKNGADSINLE